jgi:ABC-2 type transport system permease protein
MKAINLWHCYYGITREHMVRIFRIWAQAFIPSIVNTTLYFVVFGQVLGSRVGDMGGVSYMMYIAPGLILMGVITNAYINVVSTLYAARSFHALDEVLASPTPNSIWLLGYISGGVFRALIIAVLMTMVAFCFLGMHAFHYGAAILSAALCAIMFSLAGFINGIFARNFDDTAIVATFVLAPLSYLGGIFYDIHRLPHVWYIASLFNPIHYLIEMFRYSLVGVAPLGYSPWVPTLIVSLICVGLFLICLYLLRTGRGIKE